MKQKPKNLNKICFKKIIREKRFKKSFIRNKRKYFKRKKKFGIKSVKY